MFTIRHSFVNTFNCIFIQFILYLTNNSNNFRFQFKNSFAIILLNLSFYMSSQEEFIVSNVAQAIWRYRATRPHCAFTPNAYVMPGIHQSPICCTTHCTKSSTYFPTHWVSCLSLSFRYFQYKLYCICTRISYHKIN